MTDYSSKDEVLFVKHVNELAERAISRCSEQFTSFLDARSSTVALRELAGKSPEARIVTYGGFADSERKMIGIFPQDIYGYVSEDCELYELFPVCFVKITGSSFSSFTHRDCLGALLSLGIKRDTLGDIFVDDDGKEAFVCMTETAGDYVCANLESVARSKVKCSLVGCDDVPERTVRYKEIFGTCASDRLDCVICLATNLSREGAKRIICSGSVNVNHFEETRCDRNICDGDVLSVRGYGRFCVISLGGITKKGRTRAIIHKMI